MDWTQLIVALAGGGGVVGIAVKIQQLMRERRDGELQEEATAISTWQAIAEERSREAAEVDAELRWYRSAYATLWAAYVQLPPPDKPSFPPAPPQ